MQAPTWPESTAQIVLYKHCIPFGSRRVTGSSVDRGDRSYCPFQGRQNAPLRLNHVELICEASCQWTVVLEGRVSPAGTCCFCLARSALGSTGMTQPYLQRST